LFEWRTQKLTLVSSKLKTRIPEPDLAGGRPEVNQTLLVGHSVGTCKILTY